MARRPDPTTPDLFDAEPPAPRAGSGNHAIELRHLLSDILKRCPHDRYEIAARMSRLLGTDVTKHQLDAWTAESRTPWRFPLEYLWAFEQAAETHELTRFVVELGGGWYVENDELLCLELGRAQRTLHAAQDRRDDLAERLRRRENTA